MLQAITDSMLPAPDEIRDVAREVVARPYYELGDGPPPDTSPPFWLELVRWLLTPFKWLYDAMEGMPDFVRWIIVVGMVLLCIALIAHIVYTFVRAIQGPLPGRSRKYVTAAAEINPAELEEQAVIVGHQGQYIEAIRLLFRASLRRIELAEKKKLRPGCTNRELLRSFRASPMAGPLGRFVEMLERKWYGNEPCERADFVACLADNAAIRQHVEQSAATFPA